MEKAKYIKVGQAPKRRRVSLRTWLARLNGWTVAWYAFLTVAGALLYKLGAAYALRERGVLRRRRRGAGLASARVLLLRGGNRPGHH